MKELESKIQKIQRPRGEQWYVGLPKAVVERLELDKGEWMVWDIKNTRTVVLERMIPRHIDEN